MFDWYFDIEFGSCFRFNSNNSQLYSYRAGTLNSLKIELYIAPITEPYAFTSDYGAYVSIQNSSDSRVSSNGIKIQVGTETAIQVGAQSSTLIESIKSKLYSNVTFD